MLLRHKVLSLFLGILLLSLTLLGFWPSSLRAAVQADVPSAPNQLASAQAEVVAAEGIVVPYKEADLKFKVSGRVTEVLVAEGEQVTAGQVLARLETRDLQQAVLRAQARLASAQAQLAKANAGARPQEISAAEAAVTIAQAGVAAAQTAVGVLQSNLAAAQANVDTAQGAVTVARGNLSAAQTALNSARANLDKVRAGSTQREIQIAEKRVELAGAELWTYQRYRDEDIRGMEGDIAVAEAMLEIAELELEKLKDPPRHADVAIAQARVAQAQADVQTMRAHLAQAQTQVAQAQAGVHTTEARLLQTQSEVNSAKARVTKAQAELALVGAGSRAEDIAVAEATVAQSTAALAKADNTVEDAALVAPFDGTIGAILIDEGELVMAYSVAMQLGDLSQLQVDTEDLSEVDVDQVQAGQTAIVTADALGGKEFPSTVVKIAPIATDHRGDTVYTVTVDLGVGPESGLRWGMSTFVEIETQ